tara:strand:+ start:1062 stop:4301 length:3240 start_codon:yes stop_codon:yes gene_type:complete
MANITQTIPALTAGISQQPDEQKIPGQVKDMVNAIPDVTQGLLKRPSGKFVASLSDSSDGSHNAVTNGKWFHYYRDENEQYIGQVRPNGQIKMWACSEVKDPAGNIIHNAGDPVDVVNATVAHNQQYLSHTNDEDIQTLTLNDFTYINNRTETVKMDTTTEPDTDFKKEMYVELKSISYSKQYALNLFTSTDPADLKTVKTATRISVELIKSSNNYCHTDGSLRSRTQRITDNTRCNHTAGDGRDAFAPNVGTKIFSVSDGGSLTDEAISGSHTYTVDVKDDEGNSVNRGTNLYFRIATTGQSVPHSSTDANGAITTIYQARYTTTHDLLHGGEGWQQGDNFTVFMKDAYYKVTIEKISTSQVQADLALARPQPTPFDTETTITAESILGDIRSAIIADNNISANDIEIIGSGLYIKHTVKFNGSTPVGELLNVVAGRVNDVGDLPTQCKNGMVVEVVNSAAEKDNYYVKFFGNNDKDGEGIWEECAKPGRKIRFDKSTMPLVLIRTADAKFRLSQLDGSTYGLASLQVTGFTFTSTTTNNTVTINKTNHGFDTGDFLNIESDNFLTNGQFNITKIDANNFSYESQTNEGNHTDVACTVGPGFSVPQWDDCLVGDDVTNPEPSFVGRTINKLLFFRNRFAILADEHIVLSRPGDFTNFWAKSAIQLIASDPVDISASSEYPAILFDGIQVNTGLVLFSKNQQFMLTTDSDAFSPLTAKINALSTYNFNPATNPISLGTTLGFLDNAGKHSRFFEMARVQREGEPEIIEQSAVVSKLFEKDLELISNSRENSVIFFSSKNTSTLYGYRYFDQINERKLASWFKWQLTGDIIFHCMLDDSLFVVVKNGSNKYQLLKYAIKADSDTFMLAENRVHLDHLMEIPINIAGSSPTAPTVTYNSTTNKSTFAKPVGLESSNQLVAYDNTGTTNLGRYGKITVNGNTLELDGNWSGESFLIGYQFTMEVKLPTIYYLTQSGQNWRADTRANTILHRVKFGFGPIGLYETTLSRTGRVDYTELFEVTNADQYISNTGPTVEDNNLRTVPIYDRNINTALSIKSTHPAPATIHNMTWEGVYTNNNYERV